ncbi:hypothetical protein E2C01_013659 [Portunus trituberculatus]|uniref:Uncharacterized protein n=1 Tax=Portunus trituberculatus TaxID=210409 RepID=A0A5B7DHL8_PORTR|nr:hypothetical protein [Portunus trituberculatus]
MTCLGLIEGLLNDKNPPHHHILTQPHIRKYCSPTTTTSRGHRVTLSLELACGAPVTSRHSLHQENNSKQWVLPHSKKK